MKKMKKKVKTHSLTVGVRDDPVDFLRVELVDLVAFLVLVVDRIVHGPPA